MKSYTFHISNRKKRIFDIIDLNPSWYHLHHTFVLLTLQHRTPKGSTEASFFPFSLLNFQIFTQNYNFSFKNNLISALKDFKKTLCGVFRLDKWNCKPKVSPHIPFLPINDSLIRDRLFKKILFKVILKIKL